MQKAIIQLTYRQIIDAAGITEFEKKVLQLSYAEYKMKSQAYNTDGSITTFTALKARDGRANSLHYKTGFAIGGLVEALNNRVPFLQDTLGQSIEFENHTFEVIESDITNILAHRVAIHYITGWFTLFDVMGDMMLLSEGNDPDSGLHKPAETFMLKMQPGLAIINYQELPVFKTT